MNEDNNKQNKINESKRKIVQRKRFKQEKKDEHEFKKRTDYTKILYNQKLSKFPSKKKRKTGYDAHEEARLEKIIFGDPSDIIDNLPDHEPATHTETTETKRKFVDKKIRNKKDKNNSKESNVNLSIETNESDDKKPVWIDNNDFTYTVDAALNAQNRKLPCERPEKLYTTYLENKYKQLIGTPKWAEFKNDNIDDLDNDILKHSCHLDLSQGIQKNLPKNIINIKALRALNQSTHIEGPIITSIEFHPSSTVALVAGTSGTVSLFQVDGHTNNKMHSMQFKKYPISKAIFLKEGSQILLGSQYYPYCHTYDLMNDQMCKIPLPHGITNMKHCEVSPDGKIIALCGKQGKIYLLHNFVNELIGILKMNSNCKALAFTPDSKMLITHGDSSEMYVWDLNTRTCINRVIDDGCISCASLDISPNSQFLATGSKQGVVNLYKMDTVLKNREPAPLKTMMNLVTSITSLKFNPTSEILSAASLDKHNAFRMMHIPSFTVFSNFPTLQTYIGNPQTISYSPGSGYLSIGNRTGTAMLYRLRHYGNY